MPVLGILHGIPSPARNSRYNDVVPSAENAAFFVHFDEKAFLSAILTRWKSLVRIQ